MALTSNPACFFHDESISSCCASLLRRGKRFWSIHVHGVVVIKASSKCISSRQSKLLRFSRNCIEGDSKYPNTLSHGKQKISPVCGSNNIISEVEKIFEFPATLVLSLLKIFEFYLMEVVGVLVSTMLLVPSADAVDALKTCTCLQKECRLELAKCIANPSCAANIAHLQTCNNRPDETECQIKCGDLFENNVVDEFNEYAVS